MKLTFHSVVAPGIMAWSSAMKKVAGYIGKVVEDQIIQEAKGLNPTAKHVITYSTTTHVTKLTLY